MNLQFPFIEASNGPDFSAEAKLIAAGFQHVAGVDEVGRGPLAGPVVAAAVILDPEAIPDGLDDSKKLTEKRREALFAAILPTARAVAWQAFNAAAIDRLNILEASMRAMARAVDALPLDCDHALVDGNRIPQGLAGRATALGVLLIVALAVFTVIGRMLVVRFSRQQAS